MKKTIGKIIVLMLIFIGVVGIIFYLKRDKEIVKDIVMGKPNLPTISFVTTGAGTDGEIQNSQIQANNLFGYTSPMEAKYMRDTITPLNKDRILNVIVNNYSNVVLGAEFEVRSLDCKRLIEKTPVDISSITKGDGTTNINLQISNMIEKDTEYVLVLILKTDRNESVYFYTRMIMLTDNYCKYQIDFVNKFSDCTFDEVKAKEIVSYLEPSATQDNSDFSQANIHSSFSQITWGKLKPEKVTGAVVSIKEILGSVGCYQLRYKIKAQNDYEQTQYYNVIENFRVKWTSTDIYLLDYNRTVEQIFDANNQNISATRINLGISGEKSYKFKASTDSKYIAFSKKNSLWLMDINKNKVTSLFAFETSEDADIRDGNDNSQIQIIKVTDEGNVQFIVYGYMNRGEHEGMVGISLYEFSKEENVVNEKIFIPFSKPYEIIKETIGKLSYVNEKNIMYLMLEDSIYSIDLSGNEYVQTINNLRDGSYAVNKQGNIIAWQSDNSKSGTNSIRILNFETVEEKEIKSKEGENIQVIGFVDEDIAYGAAKEASIITDKNGNTTVPMYELKIIDVSGKELKSYSKEGYFFLDAKITDNMINMSRIKLSEDNINYEAAPDYQIFGNKEIDTNVVGSSTIVTEKKKKEVIINFVSKVTSSDKLISTVPKDIIVSELNSLSIRELSKEDGNYYVYGGGKVLSISDKISDSINTADKAGGVVIDENGNYVWARISKPNDYKLNNVSVNGVADISDNLGQLSICLESMLTSNGVNVSVAEKISQGSTSVDILKENLKDYSIYDLSGCTFNQILYFICKGQPVLGLCGNKYELIIGYDFYNAVILSPITGEIYKQGIEETSNLYSQSGNRFVGIMK